MTTRQLLLAEARGGGGGCWSRCGAWRVCLAAGACVLLLTGWAAYRYRHSEGALLALRVGALVAFVAAASPRAREAARAPHQRRAAGAVDRGARAGRRKTGS